MHPRFVQANELLCRTFSQWVAERGDKSVALNFYTVRLAHAAMVAPYEAAIAEFLLETMDPSDRSFEIGCGYGQLPLLVALGGRRMTGIEYEPLRFAGAQYLRGRLGSENPTAAARLDFLKLRYPRDFDWRLLAGARRNVLVFTNVVATVVKEQEDEILATFSRFDEVIVMVSHFGWSRSAAEQDQLEAKIARLNFAPGRVIPAHPSNRILSFTRRA